MKFGEFDMEIYERMGFIKLREIRNDQTREVYVKHSDIRGIIEMPWDPKKATYWFIKIKGKKDSIPVDESPDEIFRMLERAKYISIGLIK